MEVKKLKENNELENRAKQHGKKSKGLSSHCKLNPDAGNVEHNVAMFNHMSSPSGGPSTNPCGPMAEGLNVGAELIDLHYDKLKVTIETRPARPASYYFKYDHDEARTVEEYIEYDYTVKKSEVVDFIRENMTENDFANIEDASDAELVAFVNEHFDDLYSKYEKMILEYFEDSARDHAQMQMNDCISEDMIQVNEKFIRSLGEDLNSLFATKSVDKNTAKEISKLEALYEKYNKIDDERHVKAITEKVRYALLSCSDNKSSCLNESVDADKMSAQDMMIDRIEDLFEFAMEGYFSRFIQPYVYRVYNRNKRASVVVKFDIDNPEAKFSFNIDGKHHTANKESDAAKIIQNAVDSKYSSSFDLALEDLSDRIRKDDLEYDDSIDAWTASEGDTQIQFQDREQHTHEFKTKTNEWGRNFVDGQHNKQPKVASHTWGRVWKDGQLVKQAEGPKYQVRAEIAKYLDAEGNIDEDWTPPENWMSYKGAWIYPVESGYEANFTGEHFEAPTLDELKSKLQAARVHRQKFSGYSERDAKLADNIKSFGREITEDTEDESEKVTARYKDWDMEERWNPNLVDCPACGDVSFDSKRGRCTQCSYRESLNENLYTVTFFMNSLDDDVMSGPKTTKQIYASSPEEAEKKLVASSTSKYYIPSVIKIEEVTDNTELKEYYRGNDSLDDVLDWLQDHDQAWNDFCTYFSDVEDDKLTYDMVVGWISEHETLYDDYLQFFNVDDSLNEDADSVEYESRECSYEMAAEIAQAAKRALKLPADEVEMLEHDINNLRSDEWVDSFLGLSDRSKAKQLFFQYAVREVVYDDDDYIDESLDNTAEYLDADVMKKGESPVEEAIETTPTKETLDEASYGGAFDIADDQYFTRDDLVDCAQKVVEHLNETFDDVFEIYNVEMIGNTLQLEVEGKELGWYMDQCSIDMRKIRVPSDLTKKYSLELAAKLIATIKDYNNI